MIARAASAVALAVIVAGVVGLVAPPRASAARYAVGLAEGENSAAVVGRLRAQGATRIVDLSPIRALAVSAPSRRKLDRVNGVSYVEELGGRAVSYTPNDPFLARQWYAAQNRAFDFWPEPPLLASVRVAVIDSGIDGTHPEFQGRIAAAKSFVGGPPTVDTQGHGTFVAGLIAARTNDGVGIAGLAPPAELLIAKVVGPDRSIPVEAEAKAIRWAVANGARIINMSLGGSRDPLDPSRDTYSQLEADAVAYAVAKGVLVVAAVGNADQAPAQPWPYASWPAALPHVVGVSAFGPKGGSPAFSNRDTQFNDIAAPGVDILSTFPFPLTSAFPGCAEQGYSSCGPEEYRSAEGTSFATPQVTAAAAVLLASAPSLTADQATSLLLGGAVDATPVNGCGVCAAGRDRFTGFGRLDQSASLELLATGLPAADRYEPNDGAGSGAYTLFGRRRAVDGTLDYWNDRDDVYRVYLRAGEQITVTSAPDAPVRPALALWRPGTLAVDATSAPVRRLATRPAGSALAHRARVAGWYFLHVRATRSISGAYRIAVSKSR
ncbi:MAG: S8 family serine peptidase [Thermoleophilia bacterium]|nr:S8 family serine peptidase [Thermoleophilia bacterium]